MEINQLYKFSMDNGVGFILSYGLECCEVKMTKGDNAIEIVLKDGLSEKEYEKQLKSAYEILKE